MDAGDGPISEIEFDIWMKAVEVEVERLLGVSVHDLPDVPFRQHYDDGMTALDVAEEITSDMLGE